MSRMFEELAFEPTPIGSISLRRRLDPKLGYEVFEIKLGDEFLMSSAFTASEDALASLGVTAARTAFPGQPLDVVVGGLGLGHTAATVLEDQAVRSLEVVEMLSPVIDWHEAGLVPLGKHLSEDPRCRFTAGDFFALVASEAGLGAHHNATRSWWISITHRTPCSMIGVRRSNPRRACLSSNGTCTQAAFSACGQTTRQTIGSRRNCGTSSAIAEPKRSDFTTHCATPWSVKPSIWD